MMGQKKEVYNTPHTTPTEKNGRVIDFLKGSTDERYILKISRANPKITPPAAQRIRRIKFSSTEEECSV
jgi:hypothetical protein